MTSTFITPETIADEVVGPARAAWFYAYEMERFFLGYDAVCGGCCSFLTFEPTTRSLVCGQDDFGTVCDWIVSPV